MKDKFKRLYMDWALRVAELSHARRLQVGAVIVKDDTVISYGSKSTESCAVPTGPLMPRIG